MADTSPLAAIGTIAGAVVTLAIVSVVIGGGSNTAGVIGAATGGLATIIKAATAPVSGGSAYGGASAGSSALQSAAAQPLGALSNPSYTSSQPSGNYSYSSPTLGGSGLLGDFLGQGQNYGQNYTSGLGSLFGMGGGSGGINDLSSGFGSDLGLQ